MKVVFPNTEYVAMVKVGDRRLYLADDTGKLTSDRFAAIRFAGVPVPVGYTPVPV